MVKLSGKSIIFHICKILGFGLLWSFSIVVTYAQTSVIYPFENDIIKQNCNVTETEFEVRTDDGWKSADISCNGTEIYVNYTVETNYSSVGEVPFTSGPDVDYMGCSNMSCRPHIKMKWNPKFTGKVKFFISSKRWMQLCVFGYSGQPGPTTQYYIDKEGNEFLSPTVSLPTSTIEIGGNISFAWNLNNSNLFYNSFSSEGKYYFNSNSEASWSLGTDANNNLALNSGTNSVSTNNLGVGSHTLNVKFSNACRTIGPLSSTFTILPTCAGKTVSLSITDNSGTAVTGAANFGIKLDKASNYRLKVDGLPSLSDYSFSDNGGGDVTWGSDVTAVSGSSNSFYKTFSITPRSPAIAGLYSLNLSLNQTATYYSTCPQTATQPVGVGGANQTISKNCLITIPDDLTPASGVGNEFVVNYDPTKNVPGLELSTFVYTVESKIGIIVKDGVTLSEGSILKVNYTPPTTTSSTELADLARPWTQETSYDEEGNIVSDTRTYMDASMNVIQVQSKNIAANVVLASQILYDQYNRPAIQTLPAPVRTVGTAITDACGNTLPDYFGLYFGRKDDFVSTGTTAANYGPNNFENTSTTVQKRFNPDPLNNLGDGTLGKYYGNGYSATDPMAEPYAPKTNYPYVRMYTEEVGSTTKSYTTLPGDYHHLGSTHFMSSEVGPSFVTSATTTAIKDNDVLDKYLLIYAAAGFTAPTQAQLSAQLVRSISTDTEGKKQISYSDNSGNTIITRHYDSETWAFNIYDLKGRLRYEISPNGVAAFTKNVTANTTNFSSIDKTTYNYNFRGDLVSKSNNDGGTTTYMYRTDGQIRFSQSAVQASTDSPKRFSYTHYDELARPIESGEITLKTPTTGTNDFASFGYSNASFTNILDNTYEQGMPTELQASTTEWIKIWYDGEGGPTPPSGFVTDFLVGKVSCTQRKNGYTTWFSYDDLGRTTSTAMQIPGLGTKTIAYTYNKYGQVAEVIYQRGQSDGFTHSYDYDASARLMAVSSQRPGAGKVQEATYSYYLHGPLKEEKIAKGAVNEQTRFYTYTPQGWLKAINYRTDPSSAGNAQLFHEKLDYFEGDYGHANTTYPYLYKTSGVASEKFNGIPVAASFYNKAHASDDHFAYSYSYDTKNQFLESSFGTLSYDATNSRAKITYPTASGGVSNKYKEKISGYDANGNIQGLDRYNGAAVNTHDFDTYAYATNTNRLGDISDGTTSTAVKLRKYTYDASGRTVKEEVNGGVDIDMSYNISGMVTSVKRGGKSLQSNDYSDGGHRYKQTVYSATGTAVKETYFVQDSEGNLLAVYEKDLTASSPAIVLAELPIVGLSRIGNIQINGAVENYSYELNDHLGNVRVVFDRDLQESNLPSISNFSDYYPYGLPIPGRGVDGYRYGYQGQFAEYDKGSTGLFSFYWRNYDSEVGRWKNVDIEDIEYSPYIGMGNNPFIYIDPDGGTPWNSLVKDKLFSTLSPKSGFGMRIHPVTGTKKMHYGIDLKAPKGSGILAAADGKVRYKGNLQGYGNLVIISHGKGYYSLYAHIRNNGILVNTGDDVSDGQVIAEVGNTGVGTGPHLHFELYKANSLDEVLNKSIRKNITIDPTSIYDLQEHLFGPSIFSLSSNMFSILKATGGLGINFKPKIVVKNVVTGKFNRVMIVR